MNIPTFLSIALATTGLAAPAAAQQNYNGVRVMIAADDADPNSVVRSSDMYHRLQIPLLDEMTRGGYQLVFEDALAAEQGWKIEDRSDKQKSIDLAKVSCKAGKSTLCPRVLVLVRTRAVALDRGFGTLARVRMTGELIDVATNTYLGGWEAPTLEFPGPHACNNVCLEDLVGDNGRKVALNLADTLRKMLDQQAFGSRARSSGGAVTGHGGESGLVNHYQIAFEHFQVQEVLPLKAIIEKFSGTRDVSLPEGGANAFSFNLATDAKSDRVFEWLNLMLEDRGYDLNKVKVTISGDKFLVDRIVDDGYRPSRGARPIR